VHKSELQAAPELPEPEPEAVPLEPEPEPEAVPLEPEPEPELELELELELPEPEPELLSEALASGVPLLLEELQAPMVAIARTEMEPMTVRHADEHFS
jgi:hypothetical protein